MPQLSTSDWIAIVATIVQVIVAVSIGVWQTARTPSEPPKSPAENQAIHPLIASAKWYLRSSAVFFVNVVVSGVVLWQQVDSAEAVTRGSVLVIGVVLCWLTVNLLCIVVWAAAAGFRPAYLALRAFIDKHG